MDTQVIVAIIVATSGAVGAYIANRVAVRAQVAKEKADENAALLGTTEVQLENWKAIVQGLREELARCKIEVEALKAAHLVEVTAVKKAAALDLMEEQAVSAGMAREADRLRRELNKLGGMGA